MSFKEQDQWTDEESHLPQPTEAPSTEEAVFIGQQGAIGDTVAIGREDSGEWIVLEDEEPIELDEVA